jgi:hypothetical protein
MGFLMIRRMTQQFRTIMTVKTVLLPRAGLIGGVITMAIIRERRKLP